MIDNNCKCAYCLTGSGVDDGSCVEAISTGSVIVSNVVSDAIERSSFPLPFKSLNSDNTQQYLRLKIEHID